jgi:hypothetical protein
VPLEKSDDERLVDMKVQNKKGVEAWQKSKIFMIGGCGIKKVLRMTNF